MKELGKSNPENGETGLEKYGMGRGSLQIIRRLPVGGGNLFCYRRKKKDRL